MRLASLVVAAVLPTIRALSPAEVDAEDFGAKADNSTLSSGPINDALKHVSKLGGGIVHVRGGSLQALTGATLTYRVARIEMQNNTELRIASHVRLHASPEKHDWTSYKANTPPGCGGELHEDGTRGTIFFANRASNFIIGGGGAVDGGGTVWNNDDSRGHFLVFYSCADATVQDLSVKNSAAWTMNPKYSERLVFQRLRIEGDPNGPNHHNTDGFDPFACRDVAILDSYYSAGDDCVAVKSGTDPNTTCTWATENVMINNLTCASSHGLTIGSEVSGGIRNVTFANVHISNSGPSVRIKSKCGRGASVSEILYENITAENVEYAVWLDMTYGGGSDQCYASGVTAFSNITVRNLHAHNMQKGAYVVRGLIVDGHKGAIPVQNLTLDNVTVTGHNSDKVTCTHASGFVHNVHPPLDGSDQTCLFKQV